MSSQTSQQGMEREAWALQRAQEVEQVLLVTLTEFVEVVDHSVGL